MLATGDDIHLKGSQNDTVPISSNHNEDGLTATEDDIPQTSGITDQPTWKTFENLFQREEATGTAKPNGENQPDTSPTLPDDPFLVAVALWCDLFGITRTAYSIFIAIRTLSKPESLANLPKSFQPSRSGHIPVYLQQLFIVPTLKLLLLNSQQGIHGMPNQRLRCTTSTSWNTPLDGCSILL